MALAVRITAGRLASIGVTAACGAFMAYFLMPPALSFHVSRPADLATLAGYGGFGLVLSRVRRRKPTQDADWQEGGGEDRPLSQDNVSVASAAETLRASDLRSRLSGTDVVVDEDAVMPWVQEDMTQILSAVVTDAMSRSSIQRLSIYGGRRPGIRRLVVAAHRMWPHPQNVVITIGKADRDCHLVRFLALPRNSRASWFDNGFEYIYQFTAEEPCGHRLSVCKDAHLPESRSA